MQGIGSIKGPRSSMYLEMSCSSVVCVYLAPMKVVLLSDLRCLIDPCIDRKLFKVLMKFEVDMESIISKRTALVLRQAKMTTHLLLSAAPPRVRRVVTPHGPNTSSPT